MNNYNVSFTILRGFPQRFERAQELKLLTNPEAKLFQHRKWSSKSTITQIVNQSRCKTFNEILHQFTTDLYRLGIKEPLNWERTNRPRLDD